MESSDAEFLKKIAEAKRIAKQAQKNALVAAPENERIKEIVGDELFKNYKECVSAGREGCEDKLTQVLELMENFKVLQNKSEIVKLAILLPDIKAVIASKIINGSQLGKIIGVTPFAVHKSRAEKKRQKLKKNGINLNVENYLI